MSNSQGLAAETSSQEPSTRRRPAYAPDAAGATTHGEIDLLDIGRTLWDGRWLILAVTLGFAGVGLAYALLSKPWYRSDVLLIASENTADQGLAGQLGQLGGLASLAGLKIGTTDKIEPIAILKSRDFAQSFIERRRLLTVLFADRWDADKKRWLTDVERTPDIRDAIFFFDRKVRHVAEDRKTGLVTLSVEWKDPVVAARWANDMAREINQQTRDRALRTAKSNIAYLQSELEATRLLTLQQAVGRLLESEMQKLMLAQGNEEFAFRVIDKGQVPKRSFKPKRIIAVVGAAMVGMFLAMFFLLARETYRRRWR